MLSSPTASPASSERLATAGSSRRMIRRPRSFFYSANLYLGRLLGIPAIQIPEMNIDRPVETLLAQLEEKAGRKFNRAGGEAVPPE